MYGRAGRLRYPVPFNLDEGCDPAEGAFYGRGLVLFFPRDQFASDGKHTPGLRPPSSAAPGGGVFRGIRGHDACTILARQLYC